MAKDNVVRNNIWKWLTLFAIATVSFLACKPPMDVKGIKDGKEVVLEKGKIRLGLDLRGGSSFTLGVSREQLADSLSASNPQLTNNVAELNSTIDKILADCDKRVEYVINRRINALGTNEPLIQTIDGHRYLVQIPGTDDKARNEARAILGKMAQLEFRLTHAKNDMLVSKLLAKEVAPEGYKKSGSAGYVRITDPTDPNRFEVVSKTKGYAARLAAFQVPDPRYVFILEKRNGIYIPNFVVRSMDEKIRVTGEHLETASVRLDPITGSLSISFKLNGEGGSKFKTLTRSYKPNGAKNPSDRGRQLAIVLDNELISAPVIQSEIECDGQITGSFSAEEADELATLLRAGALPVPLEILSESLVAPTVGEQAIHSGMIAAGMGFALVSIFMFIYYWRSGLVADIALFLDIALLPTALVVCANILCVFDPGVSKEMGGGASLTLPVLTMPGIAGIVLSLGMAVDANVLIFERIREEFQAGKAAGDAIKNGYGRAFTAILDSNLTTIITGIILFVVGTGPVRGFAITLTAGVVISMFTAVVVTRLVFDHCVDPSRTKPFKMMQFFKNPKFDFMKLTKLTVGGAFAIILIGMIIFAVRVSNNPASVLSVDLTGGTLVGYNVKAEKGPSSGDISKALADFDANAVVQYSLDGKSFTVKTVHTDESEKGVSVAKKDVGNYITTCLTEKFPEANLVETERYGVGSVIGDALKESGTKAVIFSLLAILIYVGFRFKFGFGLGALVALAHDALIALVLFSLCGRQLSLIVITAVLTIIGYSVNDTVVVFDRIREMLNHDKKLSFYDLCNAAVNSCLSRTVITSVTTFFVVAALFVFADGSIFDFAFIMLIGVVAGTFSSVFIATPIMFWWYRGKRPDFDEEKAIEK